MSSLIRLLIGLSRRLCNMRRKHLMLIQKEMSKGMRKDKQSKWMS